MYAVFNLFFRNYVLVTRHGVLHSRCCKREVKTMLGVVRPFEDGMQVSTNESIANTHRINDTLNVVQTSVIELAFWIKQAGEHMMVGGNLVAHRHEEVLAARAYLLCLGKELAPCLKIHLIVFWSGIERHLHTSKQLVFSRIAEDDVALLAKFGQCWPSLHSILPKVLAEVDIERHRESQFIGHVHRLDSSLCRRLGDSAGNAGSVVKCGILEHLAPVYHSRLKRIERRVLAVVNDIGIAHGSSLLEIIHAQAVATIDNVVKPYVVFVKMHLAGQSYPTVRQACDILHIVS